MQLPPELRQAIEQELSCCETARLRAAASQLSQCYRQAAETENFSPATNALTDDTLRAAYLAVRLPATFAAVSAALRWTRELYNAQPCSTQPCEITLRSVLDLGSGPGTALWAAAQVFPTLESATAIERNPHLIAIARRLAGAPNPKPGVPYSPVVDECGMQAGGPFKPSFGLSGVVSPPANTHWLQHDLTAALPTGTWDLVLCSYALNELKHSQREDLIRRAWERTSQLLVIVEPGTKAGFANILAARTCLLGRGAHVVAPCPNALTCPMSNGNDWCHFAARVERSAEHRRLKDATLGHEDEKFSYITFSRSAPPQQQENTPARIVRHPRIFSGYTQLTFCRAGEIASTTVTRSMKADWRRLKRLGWGDRW